jgi:hypothetical protein
METINDLLRALDNKVPTSIAKRLDGFNKLNEKLALARQENEENPTDESQEKLDEIIDFISDTQEDLRYDLKELLAKKQQADSKTREEQQLKQKEEEEEKQRLELEKQAELEKEKKSGGIGWGSLVLGGALLILSAGAINYFGKRR